MGCWGEGEGAERGEGEGEGKGEFTNPFLSQILLRLTCSWLFLNQETRSGKTVVGKGGKGVLRESLEGVMRVWTVCGGGGAQDA